MTEKPISGDAEQRRSQTAAARFQSGLPPEPDAENANPGESNESESERETPDAPASG